MAEVGIEVGDSQLITSTITGNSVDRLGITEGDEVSTVIKATEVMVHKD